VATGTERNKEKSQNTRYSHPECYLEANLHGLLVEMIFVNNGNNNNNNNNNNNILS
jgi:hypothetical protein